METTHERPRRIHAPFSPEQVVALNYWQHSYRFHPFTCSKCRDNLGTRFILVDGKLTPEPEGMEYPPVDFNNPSVGFRPNLILLDRELVATINGWICPTCDYTQDWAHEFMASFIA